LSHSAAKLQQEKMSVKGFKSPILYQQKASNLNGLRFFFIGCSTHFCIRFVFRIYEIAQPSLALNMVKMKTGAQILSPRP
jgi:hypothetical protein